MPTDLQFHNIEGFVENFQRTLKEELALLEDDFKEGANPVVNAFETMFQSDAFADIQIDTSSVSDKITAIMEGVGSDAAGGIGKGAIAYDFSSDTDTIAGNFETDARGSFDSNSPARKMYPLGADVAAGIGEGAKQYSFEADGAAVANNAENAISENLRKAGSNAGKQFSAGLASGIRSGRSSVISAAVSIAKEAINAANAALKINSPSKAMQESGRYFSEGFAIGIEEKASAAIRAAQRLANGVMGPMNFGSRMEVSIPTLTADVMTAIDGAERPVNFYVNGRELGRVMAADNQMAQNRLNRSIALGVGK